MVMDGEREKNRLMGSKFPFIVNQDGKTVNERVGFPPFVGSQWKIFFYKVGERAKIFAAPGEKIIPNPPY